MPSRCGSARTASFPIWTLPGAPALTPTVIRQPGIAMDIDHPADLAAFLRMTPRVPTRTLAYLEQSGLAETLLQTG